MPEPATKLTVSLADCGRWFDDWVIERGKVLVDIQARATRFQPAILRELLKQIDDAKEASPVEAKLMLELAQAHVAHLAGDNPNA